MIALQVNGKPVELVGPTPLLDYVGTLGVDPRGIAVEVNGAILQRDGYAACTLQDGDQVEIVRMVGGGGWATPEPRSITQAAAELQQPWQPRDLATVNDAVLRVAPPGGRVPLAPARRGRALRVLAGQLPDRAGGRAGGHPLAR